MHIEEWVDFPFGILSPTEEEVLHLVLDRSFDESDLPSIPSSVEEFPFCHIFDEDSFEALLTCWNQVIVSKALSVGCETARSVASDKLGSNWPKNSIYLARGGQGFLINQETHKSFPDWAGIRRWDRHDTTGLYRNILPGDTKRSNKWGHECVVNFIVQEENEKYPLIQIYNYCLWAETSYGYIITDKELVVFYVSANEQSVDWKAIPWSQPNSPGQRGEMSVNEALWWLHMLALLEADRPSLPGAPSLSSDTSFTSSWKGKSPTPPPPSHYQIAAAARGPRNTRSQSNLNRSSRVEHEKEH